MLKWPARATGALRKLFEPLQEIDVYVEDSNDEAFYRCLLNSATNNSVQVARVFGLGGRPALLAAAAAHDHHKRRALYIIDGDFPWVRGDAPPNIVGLHQLEAYCVENLLVCEKAISLLVSQEIAITEQEAEAALGFGTWRTSVLEPLCELFAAFATAVEFDSTIPTVSQGVGVMCAQHRAPVRTELDRVKVQGARDRALLAAEAVADKDIVAARYATTLQRIYKIHDPLRAVSGKDFVLPLIDFHLQRLGCRIRRKSLRIRLASAGQMERFASLAEGLKYAARGHA